MTVAAQVSDLFWSILCGQMYCTVGAQFFCSWGGRPAGAKGGRGLNQGLSSVSLFAIRIVLGPLPYPRVLTDS